MTDSYKLTKYSIDYLSKFSSSKKNLERLLNNKIRRMKVDNKDKHDLYNIIPQVITKLEDNSFINDKNYADSKIRSLANQGRSFLFIKNYLFQKGVEKITISDSFLDYENQNPNWEIKSANIFINKKRLIKSSEHRQKNLSKMARAGFSFELCQKLLS